MKKIFFTLISILLVLSLSPISLAEESSSTKPRPDKQSRIEELKAKKEALKAKLFGERANKCEEAAEKIDQRIANFEANKENHTSRYRNTQIRLENLIEKLNDQDYDTSELAAAVTEMDVLVNKFHADFDLFINSLKSNRKYSCGTEKEEFQAHMQQSRLLLNAVKEDARSIKEHYKNEIKPALEDLRAQRQDAKESTQD